MGKKWYSLEKKSTDASREWSHVCQKCEALRYKFQEEDNEVLCSTGILPWKWSKQPQVVISLEHNFNVEYFSKIDGL